jgi:peptidoglycan/LPS O-acetylase OafA/YrhL
VSWPLLPLVWLAALGAGAVALFRSGRTAEGRSLGAVCYLLGAAALSQVVIAVVGDGYYELVKHTLLAAYATALLLAVGVGAAVSASLRHWRRSPTPTTDSFSE